VVNKNKVYVSVLTWAAVLGVFYLTRHHNYLIFHALSEMFSAAVTLAIFLLVWNMRRSLDNPFLLFIGVAYLFIGCLDLVHTYAYEGMSLSDRYEANLQTQLWIAGRYMESLSLLIGSFFLGRRLKLELVLVGYMLATALILGTIYYWNVFPACFVEGEGLTPFYIVSDFVIVLILAASIAMLVKNRTQFDPVGLRYLVASIALTIFSQVCFAFFTDVYGIPYFFGHFFKLTSFYCIYKAIVELGLSKPFEVLFRNLKASEEALKKNHEELERRVQERTAELVAANQQLAQEIEERNNAEKALRESEVKHRIVADNTYNWEWWRDQEGNFIYNSPSCKRVTQHEIQEFAADPDLLFKIIHPDDRSAFNRHVEEVEQNDVPGETEFRILRPDGSLRWLAHACQPVFDENGRLMGRRGSNRDITAHKLADDALRESEKQLQHLSSRLLTAQETERSRIARELHDELGGALAVLKLRTRYIEKNMLPDQTTLRQECRQNLKYIDQLIDDVHRLSRDLSPSILEDIGLTPALKWLVDNFAGHYGVKSAADIEDIDHLVPRDDQIMIYRTLQEALTNIGKHAQAENVMVQVRNGTGRISFRVEDDGNGFDVEELKAKTVIEKGLGLAAMNERARMLGGVLHLWSEPGKGTRIDLSIPITLGERL
jgi:PAS domain S-box-containing protein